MASMCSFPAAQEISLEGLRVLTGSYGAAPAQLLPQEGGELSSSGLVAHHQKGKCFHAQPVLQLGVACCRVTMRSKNILECPYVLLHAAEDIRSYKLH